MGQKKSGAQLQITCVYIVQNIGIKLCEFRSKRNIWLLHSLKRVLSSDTLIWCLSGIYLTVKSRLCLWFKAVCADPISFYTKQMQRLEMDCSVFTEAHRSVFSPCHLFFSSVSFGLHSFFSFWRNLHSWSYLPLGLLYGGLLVHLSLAGRSLGGCKPTENMGMPKQ